MSQRRRREGSSIRGEKAENRHLQQTFHLLVVKECIGSFSSFNGQRFAPFSGRHALPCPTIAKDGSGFLLPFFALIPEGDELAPDFCSGDLLMVAADALPLPGDCVVASITGRYACLRNNADDDVSDNTGGFVPRGFYAVASVVVERMPRE
jgi:hypothetical protein